MIRPLLTALILSATPLVAIADKAEAPAGVQSWTPADGDKISFEVLRQGKPFGQHTITFDVSDDGTITANTDVNLKAGLGPITLFKYSLDATETWKDGKLVGIKGQVDDDGDAGSVTAAAKGDALVVKGTGFDGTLPLGTLPASHWNRGQTQAAELVSTEDGEVIKVKVTEKGRETIQAGGKSIEATHYFMDSEIDVDLWYDDQDRWVKLAFSARGQRIEYVLTSLY